MKNKEIKIKLYTQHIRITPVSVPKIVPTLGNEIAINSAYATSALFYSKSLAQSADEL